MEFKELLESVLKDIENDISDFKELMACTASNYLCSHYEIDIKVVSEISISDVLNEIRDYTEPLKRIAGRIESKISQLHDLCEDVDCL